MIIFLVVKRLNLEMELSMNRESWLINKDKIWILTWDALQIVFQMLTLPSLYSLNIAQDIVTTLFHMIQSFIMHMKKKTKKHRQKG